MLAGTMNYKYKADKNKLEIAHVPTQAIKDIAIVRMYGNAKYKDPDSWRKVEPTRYINALLRHMLAVVDNPQSVDDESGLPHYMHVACNAAFLCELLKVENKDNGNKNG